MSRTSTFQSCGSSSSFVRRSNLRGGDASGTTSIESTVFALGLDRHRAELQDLEWTPITADPRLRKERSSRTRRCDQEGQNQKDRREQEQAGHGYRDVEASFHSVVSRVDRRIPKDTEVFRTGVGSFGFRGFRIASPL
jgi:hypothetical protein